jgi:small-conductance mechanosensitive channel
MDLFDSSFWETVTESLLAFLPRLGGALFIYVLARWISSGVIRLVRRAGEERKLDSELIVLLELLTRWGILAIGIVLALEQLAPGRFGSLIAGLGVAGVTIGFALQDVAKNFIAGVLLLVTRPFELGDTIEVSGFQGKVLAINLRATELRELDGRFLIIPNADVFVSPIVNFTRAPRRRIELALGVSADSDLELTSRTALQAISALPGLVTDPGPELVFKRFGESAIEGILYYWVDVDESSVFDAEDAGIKLIKSAFEAAQIEMPYPTRTIHMAQP